MKWTQARRAQKMNPSVIREILKVTEKPGIFSFAGGLPSPKTFPVSAFAAACEKVLREDGRAAPQYAASEGYAPLREMVAAKASGSVLNTVRLDKITLAMPMTGAQRRWLQTSRRAVDWHPYGQFSVMTSIGRVAPLDHSRGSFADGSRGPQPGAGLKQLGEPTHA